MTVAIPGTGRHSSPLNPQVQIVNQVEAIRILGPASDALVTGIQLGVSPAINQEVPRTEFTLDNTPRQPHRRDF